MSHDDRALLLKTDQEWAAAARAATDPEKIASYWSDDAKIIGPGESVIEGKPAIRKFITDSLNTPGFSADWQPKEAVVASSGDFGYTLGPIQFGGLDSSGKQVLSHNRYVCVWRKAHDGAWKCIIDTWNAEPSK